MRNEREVRFDAASGAWFGKSKPIARPEMEGRLWRFGELVPVAPRLPRLHPARARPHPLQRARAAGPTTNSSREPPSSRPRTTTSTS